MQTGFSSVLKYFNQKYIISMVSKNQIKLITGLHQKKFRNAHKLFVAEGVKVIRELLDSNFTSEYLFATEPVFDAVKGIEIIRISDNDLKKISALTVPNNCLAVFDRYLQVVQHIMHNFRKVGLFKHNIRIREP